MPSLTHAATDDRASRLPALDGWRAISILSVLACHMLPLGPQSWRLNETAGPMGMSLFFTLSGFLITTTLLEHGDVRAFFIRRACRILPLALVFAAVVVWLQGEKIQHFLAHAAFITNYEFQYITPLSSHFWSLCVEVHFYLFVGLLTLACGPRGLRILPFVCLAVTGYRIWTGTTLSITTHLRVDEILAGATVALVHHRMASQSLRSAISAVPLPILAFLFVVSCHPLSGAFNYLRPYLGAATVASTLWRPTWWNAVLGQSWMKYVAEVSYALYVIHGPFRHGWFAEGGVAERYLIKRPIGILATFVLAHFSTFYFERWWIRLGKRWSARKPASSSPSVAPTEEFLPANSGHDRPVAEVAAVAATTAGAAK